MTDQVPFFRTARGKRFMIWGAVMLAGLIALAITMTVTRGQSLVNLLYTNQKNTYYDFTSSILAARNRNEYGGMYPPLAQFFFWVLAHLLPAGYEDLTIRELINLPLGAVYVMFFFLVCAFLTGWMLEDGLRTPKYTRRFTVAALFLSVPFIYGIQRGNVLFICLPLMLYFCLNYDAESRTRRILSLVALAIAAGIKIYPAILGMMLVKSRRWKQVILCVAIGLAAVLIPSLLFDKLDTIRVIIERLATTAAAFDERGLGHQLGIQNFTQILNRIFGWNLNKFAALIVMAVLTMILFFLSRERWQQVFLLTAALITWPSISFVYTMIFMTVPLIAYINSDHEFTGWDIAFALLFAACFVVIPFGGQNAFSFTEGEYYKLNISTLVENFALNGMILAIGAKIVTERIRSARLRGAADADETAAQADGSAHPSSENTSARKEVHGEDTGHRSDRPAGI